MIRHSFFLLLLLFFVELSLFALPAKKGVITVNQPDGTQLRIEGHGDENFHYVTTEDGFLVQKNAAGVYEYAEFVEQKIKPLGIKARSKNERKAREKKFLASTPKSAISISPRQEAAMRKMAAQQRLSVQPQKVGVRNLAPRGLVILVNFQDRSFSAENTLMAMDSMLNADTYTHAGATASARKYFFDQSGGTYNPTFDVVGPVNLSNDIAFYGANDAYGNDIRPDSMVIEACNLADQELDIDFSQYDTNDDGIIDFVFVLYAGYGESSNYNYNPNLIWQHAWYIYQGARKIRFIDGKLLNTYACSCELSGSVGSETRDGIGAFCHEFSHVLGLPDLYPTNGAGHYTFGTWDLMDQGSYNNNSKTPPSYSAYERFFMGWLTPTYLSQSQNVTLGELQSTNQAYLISETGSHNLDGEDPDPTLFYMLENRQQVGWDSYLPGHGMLVTKIDYDPSSWLYNSVNQDPANMRIDLLEADGVASRFGDAGDTYPGSTSCREFSIGEYSFSAIEENDGIVYFNFSSEKDTALPDVFKDEEEEEEGNILVLSAKESLQLKNLPEESSISVYNLIGQLVFSSENPLSEVTLRLKQGIYLLRIKSPDKQHKLKVYVK